MELTPSFLEFRDEFLLDELSLFDSILPNIFASTPFIDIEPLETVTPELPGLIETPGMTPLSIADRVVESALQNPPPNPMAPNTDHMFPEADQSALGDIVPRTIQDTPMPWGQSRVHNMATMSEISSNDHERLLELCTHAASSIKCGKGWRLS